MVSLRLQRRLAASVLNCGRGRVWLDPNEASEVALATSRRTIKKLVKNGLVLRKHVRTHSRAHARMHKIAKRLGRHTGRGKRRGTKNARMHKIAKRLGRHTGR